MSGLMVIVRGCYLPTCFPDDGIVSPIISFVFPGPCDILFYSFPNFPSTFHLVTVYIPPLLSYLSAPSIYPFHDQKIFAVIFSFSSLI